MGNDACFVLLNLAVWSTLDMKNPLTSNYLASFQPQDYIVNPHLLEVADLVFAGHIPLGGITACHGLVV